MDLINNDNEENDKKLRKKLTNSVFKSSENNQLINIEDYFKEKFYQLLKEDIDSNKNSVLLKRYGLIIKDEKI